jgi:hypothetical protein
VAVKYGRDESNTREGAAAFSRELFVRLTEQDYEEPHHYFRLREYRNEKITLKRQRTLHKLRFEEIKKGFFVA